MRIASHNGIPFYTSAALAVPHAICTCAGGRSTGPFTSLNVGLQVGDDPITVAANRCAIQEIVGASQLLTVHQVHGDRVFLADDAGSLKIAAEPSGFDAMLSSRPGVALMIQHADCQAVLLYDPVRRVIAAIHNGWRGSVANLIGTTIARLQQIYGTEASDLRALISPSLGPCCAEFIHYRSEFPPELHRFADAASHLDFWAMSRYQLAAAGLAQHNITAASICTCCGQEFFSYRRAVRQSNGVTGRNGSVIALPGKP